MDDCSIFEEKRSPLDCTYDGDSDNVITSRSSTIKIETHTYNPFVNTTFGYNDKIRIPIQQQDLYTLPYENFLHVEGKLTKNKVVQGAHVALGNNCVAFIFDEIRYELNGVEIDRNRNVDITSTLKNYVTVSSDRSVILRNAGWDAQTTAAGYFNFCVPFYVLLGFCEDYKCLVINARHELILIRAHNDNCLTGDTAIEPTLELFKDLYEFPLLQSTTKHSWTIMTATQLEKPRYVIFAMQTGRKNIMSEDVSRFDDCKLTNAKLYLNSECYPYDDLNLDFENRCAILYDLYARFCKGYYGYEYLEPTLTFTTFLRNGPFVIIDCSRQNESVKSGTVDVRLDFECKEDVPANTTASSYTIASNRFCASWSAYHHGLRWEDEMVPYNEAKRLITAAVFEDDAIVYVKGCEKRTWLWNLFLDDERKRMCIETLDVVYEDMESLTKLDVVNTM
ncbi:PREDICTED: uncharacterized protein LOC105149506 [Acromyrmex echinatior]|uniref:uncharacterized protein LOC105149506 n=1 Tax=Acromyrmex echinatior TaxID=103372 RepID=UPI000580CFDA|nr:PREDICTED: uncharacterized protein LOC105149506 [Acromyrmex echinatior]